MVKPKPRAGATGISRRGWIWTWRSPRALIARIRTDSLVRNSLYIMTTTVVNSALGFVFWLIAARLFAPDVVGLTAAIIAASTIVALLASVGVGSTLIQSLPEQGWSASWSLTFWAGMATATATGLILGGVVLVVLPLIGAQFTALHHPLYAVAFAVGTVATTVGTVFDYVFLAERAAGNMLGRNSVVAGFKLVATALLVLVVGSNAVAILGAWALAAVVGVGLGAILLIRRVNFLQRQRPSALLHRAHGLRSRLVGHQLIGMGGAMLPYLLPLLVVARLTTRDNAYFYTTWMMGGIFLIIAPAVSQSLFAEGAHNPRDVLVKARVALAVIGAALAPCLVGVLLLGGLMLSAFGTAYAQHGVGLLRVVLLAAIPNALINVYVAVLRVQRRLLTAAVIGLSIEIGTVALAWVLLPVFGIIGVGWAWLIMQVAGCIVFAFDLVRYKRWHHSDVATVGTA
jgi:O-antigen/teichoic acid export membrane protein